MAILKITTDGDPHPAFAGANVLGQPVNSGNRVFVGQNTEIADQSKVYSINYRGGEGGKILSNGNRETLPGTPTPVELDKPIGVTLNGVPIYTSAVQISWEDDEDAGTGLTWDSQSPLNSTRFSFDLCDGASEGEEREYRYRGNAFFVNGFTNNETLRDASPYYKNTSFNGNYLAHPQEIDENSGAVTFTGGHSKIVGFALDGYPIYGPFGYSDANDPTSSVIRMKSGYEEKAVLPEGRGDLAAGAYVQDYIHVADSASDVLDEHNGRFCVTPDFKNGTYAYFLTYADNNLSTPAYPYIIGTSTKEVRS